MSHPADCPCIFLFELIIFYVISFVWKPIFSFYATTGANTLIKFSSSCGTSVCLNNFGGFPPDKLDHVLRVDAEMYKISVSLVLVLIHFRP